MKKFGDEPKFYVVAHTDGIRACELFILEIWGVLGRKYYKLSNAEETVEDPEWKYHLQHGGYNGLPVSFLPSRMVDGVSVPIAYADKVPSKSMEWVVGTDFYIPGLTVYPRHKMDFVSSWNEFTDQRTISNTSTGGNFYDAYSASQSGGTWTGTQGSVVGYIFIYKVGDTEMTGEPFDTRENTLSETIDWSASDWNPAEGVSSHSGSRHDTITRESNYMNYFAIGGLKWGGCSERMSENAGESQLLGSYEISTNKQSGITTMVMEIEEAGERSITYSYTDFKYGDVVLRPACSWTYTQNISSSMEYSGFVPSGYIPCTGNGVDTSSQIGSQHYSGFSIGDDDEEFVCVYFVEEYEITRNYVATAGTAHSSGYSSVMNGYILTPTWTGGFSGLDRRKVQLAYRINGCTVVQIELSDTDADEECYVFGEIIESDQHFVVLIQYLQFYGGGWTMNYEPIIINKVTGVCERLPKLSAADLGSDAMIFIKGFGPDVYTPPEDE